MDHSQITKLVGHTNTEQRIVHEILIKEQTVKLLQTVTVEGRDECLGARMFGDFMACVRPTVACILTAV